MKKKITLITKDGFHVVSNGRITVKFNSLGQALRFAAKLRY